MAREVSKSLATEVAVAELDQAAADGAQRYGAPSGFTCPECHGALWERKDDDLLRFRCRVGHAYSKDSLLAAQGEQLEEALWVALRALREREALSSRLAARARARGLNSAASALERAAETAGGHARTIQDVLAAPEPHPTGEDEAPEPPR